MKLSRVHPGKSCFVISVGGRGAFRRHMFDMGITPGAKITVRRVAPFGDPMMLHLRGYDLTLRRSEAENIEVEKEKN